MKFNYLAVIVPRKWLPQNTEQTRKQAWAAVTQLLLPDLGKFYSRFYPASQPWGQDISAPYSVVLGREDPVAFLNVFHQAKKKQEEAQMKVEYYKEFSHELNRDMEFKVFGHAGKPCLVFPPQDGRFFDYENFGMIEAAKEYIDAGKIQMFCCDSSDLETFTRK